MAVNNSNNVTAVDKEERSLVPPSWDSTVRTIGISEARQAGLSLAHSFAADALSLYILDGDDCQGDSPERRWKNHVRVMTYLASAHCYSGVVTTIGPDYDAVALWCLPGQHMDGWLNLLRSGLWKLNYQLSAEGRKRYCNEILPMLHTTMDEVMGKRDFYYLAYLGTKPTARGKGYAKKLIMDMAVKADAENQPIYLESTSIPNIPYYERFGFKLRTQIAFTRGPEPIPLYVMIREPQNNKSSSPEPSLTQVETKTT